MTASRLPLELISLIAWHAWHAGDRLSASTSVCRKWQIAFEPFLYSELFVCSDQIEFALHDTFFPNNQWRLNEEHEHLILANKLTFPRVFDAEKTGHTPLSLAQFQALTSGAGVRRRAWLRSLRFCIMIPHYIEDWKAVKEDGYTYNNEARRQNDKAFCKGAIDLFDYLSSWSANIRLKLDLKLLSYETCEEPDTFWVCDADEFHWDFLDGRDESVRPYRARFPNDDASILANAPCIDRLWCCNDLDEEGKLDLKHQVWGGTVLQMVEHCPTITEVHLDLNEPVRPDHEEYMRQRRQAVAEAIPNIPRTLKFFDYANQLENNWIVPMPGINVLTSETDTFSNNLRDLTFGLQKLMIEQTSLSLDWLFPLDKDAQPAAGTSHYHWPNLEILDLDSLPEFLPTGEYLFRYSRQKEAEVARIDDWEDAICDREIWPWPDRELVKDELFQRLFISLGYAVQRMPRLISASHNFKAHGREEWEEPRENSFLYHQRDSTGPFVAEWVSEGGYQPDERVAAAWGFRMKDIENPSPPPMGGVTSVVKFSSNL
ncbi:hypothetical protein BO70DRAFT_366642 [Aspergillus heteromorphus CBS 117.55]|uniref:F-box domain-containing protein n=1 Tax=Aspergillus heteromorphus CBS 117.55 TaxID=1448321 RepID=A0A317UWD2_9EURO|nr:uncharacterized protein BO70DRAFT_366642 [Aspergillus heteromorphus CBS 117.55]PWY65691.1 hypothetical protein BO70DRAFT_366642 [Aspergillus heteromorphus CBS 117.55]